MALDVIVKLIRDGKVVEEIMTLPEWTVEDEGKVLAVVDGNLVWVYPDAVTADAVVSVLGEAPLSAQYDLKDGYGYTEDVYIAADGTEIVLTEADYKCLDYIPVKRNVSYTMFGVGYALYDAAKAFLTAEVDTSVDNQLREFTPTVDGFVRLTINSPDIMHARFCRTSEKDREPREYEGSVSPFYDPAIPCYVHLYGDSNSEGYGLEDASLAWSNRLGALITSMPEALYHCHFLCYAAKDADKAFPALKSNGLLRMTAFTDKFTVMAASVGEIAVFIDGVEQTAMTASPGVYTVELGKHVIELRGVSGTNYIQVIGTNKKRTFDNHAVYGSVSGTLPAAPEGNVSIVMYGTNDRMTMQGTIHKNICNFKRACEAAGGVCYVFTPIPTLAGGETGTSYYQTINDVIAQLPADCINIYKEIQLAQMFSDETLYHDNLHLNELGHKVLYAVAASKLQLAALNSQLA